MLIGILTLGIHFSGPAVCFPVKKDWSPADIGHAYLLFDSSLSNGHHNEDKNLTQYMNGSVSKPPIGDILVFGKNDKNRFGHFTLVRELSQNEIERIQQNVGKISRVNFSLVKNKGGYYISNESILGWLRKLEK